MRIHTGKTPDQCYLCKRFFKRLNVLKNHLLKVHGVECSGIYRKRLKNTSEVLEGDVDDVFVVENLPDDVADVVTISTDQDVEELSIT